MSNEPNTRIYEKMEAEQQQYREWLLAQPPDEILKHTYEYTMRQDILMAMEEMDLLTYLRNYEPHELVHFGGNTYCTCEHDSLKISNGK